MKFLKSPLAQMTMALVALAGTLVLLADLFFGVLPDRGAQALAMRKHLGEALGVQVAALLQSEDHQGLDLTLQNLVRRNQAVHSVAVRRSDGQVMFMAGDHHRVWRPLANDQSVPEQMIVPISAGEMRWGGLEIAFRADDRPWIVRWLSEPLMITLLFISFAGTVMFGLYMRRALQHLDPAAVIPERVQGAYDAMAEGVVALDAKGRIVLANRTFRALHGEEEELLGRMLSQLSWLRTELPAQVASHPWMRALGERAPNAGFALEVRGAESEGDAAGRKLMISCAPIADTSGAVRGCIVTFNDVTEVQRANERLREMLVELSISKDEIEKKNAELHRLATRDPLTGCLNRRAYFEAFDPMLAQGHADGTELGVLILDIDHFKSVNDTYGHPIGDRVIQEVAKKVQAAVRNEDLVCRYGGEEFCVLVPGADRALLLKMAERVRERIEREVGPAVREIPGMRVTASVGASHFDGEPDVTSQTLIDRADHALYRSKRGGRNRVTLFDPAMTAEGADHA